MKVEELSEIKKWSDLSEDEQSLFHVCSKDFKGSTEERKTVVERLLEKGVDINVRAERDDFPSKENTALISANALNDERGEKLFLYLLDAGATFTTEEGEDMLHGNIMKLGAKNPRKALALLEKGVKLVQKDSEWESFLSKSIKNFTGQMDEETSRTHEKLVLTLLDMSETREDWLLIDAAGSVGAASKIIPALFAKGPKLNSRNTAKAFSAAFKARNILGVEALIAGGADVNWKSDYGYNLLHFAAQYKGTGEIISLLVKKGLKVNAKSKGGETPLVLAVTNSSSEGIKALVSAGANLHESYYGGFLLHYALRLNLTAIILELVNQGIDINVVDKSSGLTPLAVAFSQKYPNIKAAIVLIKAGARIEKKEGEEMLHNCVHGCRNYDLALALLERGVKPVPKESDHVSFLWRSLNNLQSPYDAREKNVSRIEQLVLKLIEVSEDPAKERGYLNRSLLHDAAEIQRAATTVIPALVNRGCELDAKDSRNATPLAYAISTRNINGVRALLSLGANPNLGDEINTCHLMMALEHPTNEMALLLLKHKANLHTEIALDFPTGILRLSPLHIACLLNDTTLVKAMFEAADPLEIRTLFRNFDPQHLNQLANANIPYISTMTENDQNGVSPMDRLLQEGGPVNPFHIAKAHGNEALIKTLLTGWSQGCTTSFMIACMTYFPETGGEKVVKEIPTLLNACLMHPLLAEGKSQPPGGRVEALLAQYDDEVPTQLHKVVKNISLSYGTNHEEFSELKARAESKREENEITALFDELPKIGF